jgi:hypothetical protein
VAFPTITLGGTFVSALIQGKSVPEAIQILAEQIDVLIGRVNVIEDKQSSLEKKVYCSELVRHTPDRGPGQWINIDIAGFYQSSLEQLEQWKIKPDPRPGEQQAEIDFWQGIVNEAKPMYDNYIEKCGEVETSENEQGDQGQNTEGDMEANTETNKEYLEREAREAFNLQKPEGTVTVTSTPIGE